MSQPTDTDAAIFHLNIGESIWLIFKHLNNKLFKPIDVNVA